jgi:hypothetical protein
LTHSMAFLPEGSKVQLARFRIFKKTAINANRGKWPRYYVGTYSGRRPRDGKLLAAVPPHR